MIRHLEWVRVATGLPDDEITILLAFEDYSVCEGYRDGVHWRNASGAKTLKPPIAWAEMPSAPLPFES